VKRCIVCGETKSFDEFYAASGMRDGYRSECKVCNLAIRKAKYAENPKKYIDRVTAWRRAHPEHISAYYREYRQRPERKRADREGHLRRKYGITVDDYERMLVEQSGGCAVCAAPPPERGSLHVDHDHETGAVRGLLCVSCNNAIGAFREQYALFQRAADYLDRDDALAALARTRVKALTG
jgi:hypothetical protein